MQTQLFPQKIMNFENIELPVEKSEILFLYESSYSMPNGDPFTGEQRYDEETKKVLVSDVRIKRFVRDHFALTAPNSVYVLNDASVGGTIPEGTVKEEKSAESGASERLNALSKLPDLKGKKAMEVLTKLIDVRLFGGISTKTGDAVNLTGPVQFALLNPSLNAVDLRMHQNTSVFASSTEKTRGAIGTTTVVPYALMQIHGWINPFTAIKSQLQPSDVAALFSAMWDSINNANTRSKSNQNSLLLLQIVYAKPTKKLYGVDRKIELKPRQEKRGEQLRSRDDYDLDFSALLEAAGDAKVAEIRFYTEDAAIKEQLNGQAKFVELKLE